MSEKEKKIKELKERIFMIEMNDHWSRDDYDRIAKLKEELRELEQK